MLPSDLYLWLSYSQVSTQKLNRILEKLSPIELWDSFDSEGKYALDDKTFAALKRTRNDSFISRAKSYLEANHISYITRADPAYPEALAQRETDPPPVLYYRGDINILRGQCIAVVGTRHSSPYGKYVTTKITTELADSFVIVSGLATGIDGYAHNAALDAGGKTVAVLGSGLFNVTPTSNFKLFDNICERGLVLSEYTPDVHASTYTFPQRNRIISGLSRGVIVTEAADKSGALITANCALEQGRDVFAVPGDVDKPRSFGTNRLIKQGATPITCAKDVLEFYGMAPAAKKEFDKSLGVNERRVLEILEQGELAFDKLVETSGLSVGELNTALSSLLIFGYIHEKSKNLFCIS